MLAIEPAVQQPAGWLPWVVAGIAAILGGGGVTALLRSRPERARIIVDAAEGAVVVQTGVLANLREELRAAHAEIAELRGENEQLRGRVRRLEHDAGIAEPP